MKQRDGRGFNPGLEFEVFYRSVTHTSTSISLYLIQKEKKRKIREY